MAEKKKASGDVDPMAGMDIEQLAEGLEKGTIELPTRRQPTLADTVTPTNIEKFLLGEMTWAQLQGMTMDEAYGIAEYGYALYEEGKCHEARQLFEGLVICNPYDAYFHNMLGAVYQQLDMREEAAAEYAQAVELDDTNIEAHVNRGELLLQNGEFEKALQDLKRAVELDPDSRKPAGLRARALASATANALGALQKIMGNSGGGEKPPAKDKSHSTKKGK